MHGIFFNQASTVVRLVRAIVEVWGALIDVIYTTEDACFLNDSIKEGHPTIHITEDGLSSNDGIKDGFPTLYTIKDRYFPNGSIKKGRPTIYTTQNGNSSKDDKVYKGQHAMFSRAAYAKPRLSAALHQ